MDLGRQTFLLFTRLFEMFFLKILLARQLVSSRDVRVRVAELTKPYAIPPYYVNIKSMFPGWRNYSVDTSIYPNVLLYKDILYLMKKLVCDQTQDVCIDTLNTIDSFVYLKGRFCLVFSKRCIENNVKAEIISKHYKLCVPLLSRTISVDISNLYPRFHKPTSIKCGIPETSLISIGRNGLLMIHKKLMDLNIPYTMQCLTKGRHANNQLAIILEIDLEPLTLMSGGRVRRSLSDIAFDKLQYRIDVKENEPVGSVIVKLNATGGSSAYIYSKNKAVKSDKLFEVNPESGEVVIKQELDREAGTTQYTIDVTANDKVNPKYTAITTVIITITDVNDNKPIFVKDEYSRTIPEEQPIGRFILSVQATDLDEGKNSFVTYHVVDGQNSSPFKVDLYSGVITNKRVLDREENDFYIVRIKAEDQGIDPGPLFSIVNVSISVGDINDNEPVFDMSHYYISIPEDTVVGTVILNVTATDADAGINGEVRYQPLGLSEFEIDSITGQMKLSQALDYDRYRGEYEFNLVAFDSGSPPNYANVQVKITILDVNDNTPVFTRRSSRPITIKEDQPVGTVVYTLSARDADSGVNGKITYKFSADAPENLPFSINPRSGKLKVIKPLDYETQKEYKFTVVAEDNGKPALSSRVSLTINIDNVNDNSPRFVNSTYFVSISEDTRIGSNIITVSAIDPDELEEEFEYSIEQNGDSQSCFQIDEFSGVVYLRSCTLDYKMRKEYRLKLKVSELDGKYGIALLIINIFDANNNPPRFEKTVNVLNVNEDVHIGSSIGRVVATDDDSGENARVSYSLNYPSLVFSLNISTGELRTKQLLDREQKASYQLSVKATDHGKPYPKSGTTTVIVSVKDVNDNAPIFAKRSYSFSFKEDVGTGYMVGSVLATDKDAGSNKDIRYSLSPSRDDDGCFSIDSFSGMITTTKLLDREKRSSYNLVVLATDQALNGKKSSTVNVAISLEDVQDSSPVFEQEKYFFIIEENTNSRVGKVTATLADANFQHTMRYSISKNVRNLFGIDMNRGIIQVQQPLDYEEQAVYVLQVRVIVSSGKTDTTTVTVNVTDVNDHPPVLEDFYIFLNVINGTFDPKFQVPASDKDITSIMKYRMKSNSKYKFVELNGETGEIYLQKNILNSALVIKIEFEVQDGRFTTTAFGRIAVSELSKEMIENSVFIILKNTTRDTFLHNSIMTKFKSALSATFNCDQDHIFIVSIEEFKDLENLDHNHSSLPMLEIVVAVKMGTDHSYISARWLKDMLYIHQKNFTRVLGIQIVSFDFSNEIFCSVESCNNFERCMIVSNITEKGGKTISSQYVIFRGVYVQQGISCSCPPGYRNGPDFQTTCSESYSLCYSGPCGDHGKCESTDIGFTCICEPGYSGKYCDINKEISSCPHTSLYSQASNPCGLQGTCYDKPNGKGFQCVCPGDEDSALCTLTTRSFSSKSYIALSGLSQRWNFSISFEFTTEDSNAVLLYNGRYSNSNDFISIEIIDGQVVFCISLGKRKGEKDMIFCVRSFVAGGVNDGRWHQVKVRYNIEHIDIAVGSWCDISTAYLLNPGGMLKYCSATKKIDTVMRSLDLTAPLLIGGLPDIGHENFRSQSRDFIGCIRKLVIDHTLIDLSLPMFNHLSTSKCKEKKLFCEEKDPCQKGICINGLDEAYCECPEGTIGKYCESDVRLSSPVVTLVKGSSIVIEEVSITEPKDMVMSIVVRTTQKDGDIWKENIGQKIGYLKLSSGYVCYVFDSTVLLNLSSSYISDGKWHQIKIHWKADQLFLSSGYGKHSNNTRFVMMDTPIKLIHVGGHGDDSLIGCLQGFTYGRKYISLKTLESSIVFSGCSESSVCDKDHPCGINGKCQSLYGSFDCDCKPGYYGPQCIDMCTVNPCLNGGKCVNEDKLNSGFRCECTSNYTGDFCEEGLMNECKEGFYGEQGTGLCGPCTCKVKENFDRVCDKDGNREPDSYPGKCFCRDTFYNSEGTCVPCSCLKEGSSSQVCDKLTGKCSCLPGATGRKCDQCPGAWQELTSQCNEINTSCPKSYMEGIWWNRVSPGATKVEACPRGAFGNATRYCHFRKSWSPPNLFGCVTIGFHNIHSTSKHIMKGNEILTQNWVSQLATQLEYAVNTSQRLYGKDVEIGYATLRLLIEFERNHTGGQLASSEDPDFVWNLLTSASKLLSLSVKKFWDLIQAKNAGSAGLMMHMANFVEILSSNFAYVKRRRYRRSAFPMPTLTSFSEATENIYLEIQPINIHYGDKFRLPQHQNDWAARYSVWSEESVQVIISKEFFSNYEDTIDQVNIGIVVYKTLGKLLPSRLDIEKRKNNMVYDVEVVSHVFSLVIPDLPTLSANQQIKIVYKNVNKSMSSIAPACAFWNYSTSPALGGWSINGCETQIDNSTDITCFCDYHTSFGLILSRTTEVIPRVYQINFLTYVSMGISMLLLIIGFFVFFCLGQLKTNANSIHKNLALVAFLAELVFVAAVNRPDIGESTCRIVAICIHYFVTCTFCWLLVEALHMYRMILEPRDINYGQMMFYYFIGWGAPVMVVGVTAGLKPEGYGNSEFCWVSIKESEDVTWTYLAPIMAVIGGNIILVLVAIIASCEKQKSVAKKGIVTAIQYRLAISMVFLPLLGGTVIAGLIVVSYDHKIFMYLFPGFCILDGLYVFFFYVIFNGRVRQEAKNAFIRWKTGDKTYGIKQKKKRMNIGSIAYGNSKNGQRPGLQTFNIGTSSTSESSDPESQRRRARIFVAGSETTDFPTTTNNDSSDSSEDDSDARNRRAAYESDSDSSDSGDQVGGTKLLNGKVQPSTQWKKEKLKKNNKQTYASDGPMHSTPSDTSSDRKKKYLAGFAPTKLNIDATQMTILPDSDSEEDVAENTNLVQKTSTPIGAINPASIQHLRRQSNSSHNGSDSPKTEEKGPVSILKKKSQYDANSGKNRLRAVRVKDKHNTSRRPLMPLNDSQEFNDSQV